MADVQIGTDGPIGADRLRSTLIWTTADIGYFFYDDADVNSIYYKKTSDGGATWGSRVSIDGGVVGGMAIWYDKWTPGDSGTKIHITWIEASIDDLMYRSLDTSGDTLGSQITVESTINLTLSSSERLAISKATGGNLYITCFSNDKVFYRSTDAGATWTARDSTTPFPIRNTDDQQLYPDPTVAEDMVMVYLQGNTGELHIYKYDDSGDSWTETTVDTITGYGNSSARLQMGSTYRHSDDHIIVSLMTRPGDDTANDLKVYDIDPSGTPSAVEKTEIITNTDDWTSPDIYIESGSDDLYVVWIGKDDGSEILGVSTWVNVWYAISDDGGSTWATAVQYSTTKRDYDKGVAAGKMVAPGDAGRFAPIMFVDITGGDTMYINKGNSVVTSGGTAVTVTVPSAAAATALAPPPKISSAGLPISSRRDQRGMVTTAAGVVKTHVL